MDICVRDPDISVWRLMRDVFWYSTDTANEPDGSFNTYLKGVKLK